jgi:DNA-binding NtrC family response regulator
MRVLIVEDERDMAQVLKVGLEEENHLVSLAFDGVSGLEVARACDFDVIVLDVIPKLDGFEVARRLRAKGDRTPILMLTARDTDKRITAISDEFMTALARHSWPGNVRELQNLIERSVILSTGDVLSGSLPVAP